MASQVSSYDVIDWKTLQRGVSNFKCHNDPNKATLYAFKNIYFIGIPLEFVIFDMHMYV